MSWLFSRALVEEYSAGSSSDGAQFVRSKLIRMQQASSRRGKTTAAFRHSQFGTTYARSTGGHGAALLTWFLAASRARTSAPLEKAPESPEPEADSGKKWHGSLAKYDPASASWKTHQYSLLGGLEPFSGTWPRWGTMRGGECWEQTTPSGILAIRASITSEPVSSCWRVATPCAADGQRGGRGDLIAHVRANAMGLEKYGRVRVPTPTKTYGEHPGRVKWKPHQQIALSQAVRLMPQRVLTPKARDYRTGDNPESRRAIAKQTGEWHTPDLNDVAAPGGQLNPDWVEWLMGWPIGWTDSNASGTGKFRRWLNSHGTH